MIIQLCLLTLLLSSVPHSLFYSQGTFLSIFYSSKASRNEAFSRLGIGFTFLIIINAITFPFFAISEFFYFWKDFTADGSFFRFFFSVLEIKYIQMVAPIILMETLMIAIGLLMCLVSGNPKLAGFYLLL